MLQITLALCEQKKPGLSNHDACLIKTRKSLDDTLARISRVSTCELVAQLVTTHDCPGKLLRNSGYGLRNAYVYLPRNFAPKP